MSSVTGPTDNSNIAFTGAVGGTGAASSTNTAEPIAVPANPPALHAGTASAVQQELAKIRNEAPNIRLEMKENIGAQWIPDGIPDNAQARQQLIAQLESQGHQHLIEGTLTFMAALMAANIVQPRG